MQRLLTALVVAALLLPGALASPDPALALPAPPPETQVCHGPSGAGNVCASIVHTVFGTAIGVSRLVETAACGLGACGLPVTDALIFLYRNLP